MKQYGKKIESYIEKGYFGNADISKGKTKERMRNFNRIVLICKENLRLSTKQNALKERFPEETKELMQIEYIILKLRYFKTKPWEEIADILHYSRAQVFRIHDRAIQKLEEMKTKETIHRMP